MPNVSLIVTVLNEANTVKDLLDSIAQMKVIPEETIVVDGGSFDKSFEILEKYANTVQGKLIGLKVFQKKGNRSVGRNFAIEHAKYEWIAITDAGCRVDKNWLGELTKKVSSKTKLVSGYYQGVAITNFQEAVIPYVLVMPDRVDSLNFKPATRSMMLKKSLWEDTGKFDEKLSHNEDFEFAHKLFAQTKQMERAFAANAIVYWYPSSNIESFIKMIFRFALGDMEAGILRPKVTFIFGRYLLGLLLLIVLPKSLWLYLFAAFLLYLGWAVWKNKKYVESGWWWLPVLQVTSDVAVMTGSLMGLWYLVFKRK